MQPSNSVDNWDALAFDLVENGAEANSEPRYINTSASSESTNTSGPLPIEEQIIALPSNGNTSNDYRELELAHRISMAEDQLNNIRNLIADKSFQFSHVIRVSPRKGVATRARAAVKRLNNQIAEHGRMYTRCRSCLVILGADPSVLSTFKILNPVDVAGSTAILNPNEPGSSSIKLSWIWQTSATHWLSFSGQNADVEVNADLPAEDPASLLECVFSFFSLDYALNYPQFDAFIGCVLELNK